MIFSEKSITVTVGWCLFQGCLFSGRMQGPFRAWTFYASSMNPRRPPSPTVWTRKRCLGLLQHQGGDLSFNGWQSDHLLMLTMMMMMMMMMIMWWWWWWWSWSWNHYHYLSLTTIIHYNTIIIRTIIPLPSLKNAFITCHRRRTSWSTTSEASVASVIGRVTLRVTVLETQK